MPLVQTRGAASAQGFGEFAQVTAVNYIEDVFSTYLYTGTGAALTITNNIDLSTKGGLVWFKPRTPAGYSHFLYDTSRGIYKSIRSNTYGASQTLTSTLTAFNTTGFTLGNDSDGTGINTSAITNVSWTFREQPKFFDVVTWTGDDVVGREIPHNLGSVPGCMLVKRLSNGVWNWVVYHRSLGNTKYLVLNDNSFAGTQTYWNNTTPTSTVFTVGDWNNVNRSPETYVAYLFAHNAGGFGLTGTDNVVSCSSYTGNGLAAGPSINLGYEPQFVIIKHSSGNNEWELYDNMRGVATGGNDALLRPSTDSAEEATSDILSFTSTGFQLTNIYSNTNGSGETYIYIAIRRGPMKVPTVGTSVFGLNYRNGSGAIATVTGGAGVSDAVLVKNVGATVASLFSSRLTNTGYLVTSSTAAEVAAGATILQASPWDVMDGVKLGTTSTITNATSNTYINYFFDRAPSFCDVVCNTGNGSDQLLTHNLGVIPELVIRKSRSNAGPYWLVGSTYLSYANDEYLQLQATDAVSAGGGSYWNSTAPTSSVFSVGSNTYSNGSGYTFVTYLFATCAGVSKVGSYTGNATLTTIDCGFTTGARFVLIKITNTTGNWFVFDTARGMTVGTNPSLTLNSTSAENPGSNISTTSVGFTLAASPSYPVNSNGYNYIFLAIA